MDLATISKDELRIYRGPDWDTPLKKMGSSAINGDGMEWSHDGFLLAALNGDGGVSVYDSMSGYAEIFVAKKQFNSIRRFYFSPCNSYLVTYERFVSKDDSDNVFCHNLTSGEIGLSIKLRTLTERNWPAFVWSDDERVCMHMTTNTIKVMHGRNLSLASPLYSLTIPNIAQYSLSPDGRLIAGFFPESKGQPASLRIYEVSDRSAQPKSTRSTFNAQTARIEWNKKSTALVAVFSTDSDATSSSYYGTSSLLFLRIEDSHHVNITGDSGGPCHDVCWSPTADEFVTVCGKMPAEIALYDGKTGTKRMSFGSSRRNTLRWNAFGRLFLSGGFGNLPGDIDVWDKNKGLCLSTVRVPCTVQCEFGPDGRNFFSASVFPRMRVDNFVQVVHYDGTLGGKITSFAELYAAKWRPASFEDCPPSPRVVQQARAADVVEAATVSPAKAAYRPPGGSGALAEQMRKEREAENERKAIKVKAPKIPAAEMVGPSASAMRNARKKKSKEMVAKLEASGNGLIAKKVSYISSDESEPEPAPQGPDPVKRIRNLQKKLKEIAALKLMPSLTPPQIAKVESEEYVKKEIAELEVIVG